MARRTGRLNSSRRVRRAANVRCATAGSGDRGAIVMRPPSRGVRLCQRRFQQPRGLLGLGSELGRIMARVDLQEHGEGPPQLPGRKVEQVQQFFAVHALDAVKVAGGERSLVRLQVTDQFLTMDRRPPVWRALSSTASWHPVLPDGGQAT